MKKIIIEEEKYIHLKIDESKIDALISPMLKGIFPKYEKHINWILDLSLVKYIDSSALSAILVGHKQCKKTNGQLVLVGLSEHVHKLINISQLDKILTILPTVQEAIDFIFMAELEKEMMEESND